MQSYDLGLNFNLNLEVINRLVGDELRNRVVEFGQGFTIDKIISLELMPEKGYTAKGEASIHYQGKPLGNGKVVTILFRPGEGTGNNNDFNIKGVRPSWNPRIKNDYAELFMAIGTGYQDKWLSGMTALTEVSCDRTDVPHLWPYGGGLSSPSPYLGACCNSRQEEVVNDLLLRADHFDFTLHSERNHGNPHAITFNDGSWLEDLMPCETFFQIGAFLAFQRSSPELTLIEKIVDHW
ncbi:MAG: hypothetical protein AABW79_01020 [Nanoarchaeota archaeon]